MRETARRLGRSPSTISRMRRNAATRGNRLEYRASVAQWKAELVARRPKTAKLVADERLREYVQQRLAGHLHHADGTPVAGPATGPWKGRNKPRRQDRRWVSSWSPQQISERLKIDFPDDPSMRISHEAIYQALYVQSRGALRRELVACLRTGRALRVPRAHAPPADLDVADPQLLAAREHRLLDPLAVDEGAVGRAEVAHAQAAGGLRPQLRVVTRRPLVTDDEVATAHAAEDERSALLRRDLDGPPGVRAGHDPQPHGPGLIS